MTGFGGGPLALVCSVLFLCLGSGLLFLHWTRLSMGSSRPVFFFAQVGVIFLCYCTSPCRRLYSFYY